MAWAKEIDQARDHLAVIAYELAQGLEDRVRAGGEGISDDERVFKVQIKGMIETLSLRLFEAPGIEVSVSPTQRAKFAKK